MRITHLDVHVLARNHATHEALIVAGKTVENQTRSAGRILWLHRPESVQPTPSTPDESIAFTHRVSSNTPAEPH